MENKYNINRNREPLTPEDIAKGQNFDSFMKAYGARPKPFFRSSTFYLSVAAAGIVIGVGAYLLSTGTPSQQPAQQSFVQPPLANIDVKDTAFTVSGAQGGDFLYATGSLIRVPEGAFLDSAGNVVTGNVELHYREFHDPASIFLAGIPMTYDSAGSRYHFESAGMLEITATLNGKPLKVNPAQPIKVAMASATKEDKFNIYYLDTLKKNWQFIAKDKAALVAFVADTANVQPKTNASNLQPPVMPVKADKNVPSFAIAFDPNEFPELNAYKGVRFQVDEKQTPYDRNDKKVQWEDAQIKRNKDNRTYTVTFTKGDRQAVYVTTAVVDEVNYPAAKKTYEQRFAEYQASLLQRKEKEKKEHDALESRLMNADARRIFVNDSLMNRAMALSALASKQMEKEDMVMREFIIRDFGTWNSDCPSSLPEGAQLNVQLLDSRTKKPLGASHVFLVEKGRNAIFTYYSNALTEFRFNPSAENMLWTVTPDGKLAVLDTDAFSSIDPNKKGVVTLTMQVKDEPLATAEQARAALGI